MTRPRVIHNQEEDKRQEATAHHFLYEIHTCFVCNGAANGLSNPKLEDLIGLHIALIAKAGRQLRGRLARVNW